MRNPYGILFQVFVVLVLLTFSIIACASVTTQVVGRVGEVCQDSNDFSSEFIAGDTVRIKIKIDETQADMDPDINGGSYPDDAVELIEVEFVSRADLSSKGRPRSL